MKVFSVHFSTSNPDKTEVIHYVANTMAEVVSAIPVEDGFKVCGINVGPDVKVL